MTQTRHVIRTVIVAAVVCAAVTSPALAQDRAASLPLPRSEFTAVVALYSLGLDDFQLGPPVVGGLFTWHRASGHAFQVGAEIGSGNGSDHVHGTYTVMYRRTFRTSSPDFRVFATVGGMGILDIGIGISLPILPIGGGGIDYRIARNVMLRLEGTAFLDGRGVLPRVVVGLTIPVTSIR